MKDSVKERGRERGRERGGRPAEGAICYAVLALQAALSVETEEEHRRAEEEQEEELQVELEEAAAAAAVVAATATFAPATFSLFASKSHCSLAALLPRCLAATERLNGVFCHFCFKVKLFRIILQCSQVANSVKRQLHKLPTNSRPLPL